jgi:hypothetical protein
MGTVTTALREEAESIFTNLGYTVTPQGNDMRAERKWRVVQVTPMAEPEAPPQSGELRCFVTFADTVSTLERKLTRENPEYEWAIIGVRDNSEYIVRRSST